LKRYVYNEAVKAEIRTLEAFGGHRDSDEKK
jgi:hypothetical protein